MKVFLPSIEVLVVVDHKFELLGDVGVEVVDLERDPEVNEDGEELLTGGFLMDAL